MRILVVGGLGFIGNYLIKSLSASHTLAVFSDAEGARKAFGFHFAKEPTVEIGDIKDEAGLREVTLKHRPEAVVHLAALTGIKRCNDNPSLAFLTNVLGTYNVAMGCVGCRSKLVFISSREVYGETRSDPTREDDPLVPNNTYGITKMLGEEIVTWASSKYDLDYTILRITNVYGPGGDQYNVQAIVKNALANGKIQISGGTQLMNLIYVEDVAEIVHRSLTNPGASREVFNVGSDDTLSVEEIISRVVTLLGVPVKIERSPMRHGETLDFRPSLEKLERVLGYHPATPLAVGLEKTVEWYKSARNRARCQRASQLGDDP